MPQQLASQCLSRCPRQTNFQKKTFGRFFGIEFLQINPKFSPEVYENVPWAELSPPSTGQRLSMETFSLGRCVICDNRLLRTGSYFVRLFKLVRQAANESYLARVTLVITPEQSSANKFFGAKLRTKILAFNAQSF